MIIIAHNKLLEKALHLIKRFEMFLATSTLTFQARLTEVGTEGKRCGLQRLGEGLWGKDFPEGGGHYGMF